MTTTPLSLKAALPCTLVAGLLLLLAGCDAGPGESLWPPDGDPSPSPVITSVEPSSPPGIVLAGIDVVTITGQNFSPTRENNFVYFNTTRAQVLEASPTQLQVRVPNLPGNDLQIRVMVLGALEYSNGISYRLVSALTPVGAIGTQEEPFGMTTDAQGNAYVSMFAENRSIGIQRITPDGDRSTYFASTFAWTDLAMGPDGILYGVRPVSAVFRLPEGGTQQAWTILPSAARLNLLTFDEYGAVWTWSTHGGGVLYRIAPDQSFRDFPLTGTVRDLAAHDGFLYAAVTEGAVSRIVRYAITGDGQLGAPEEYINITANFNAEALALAIAADGTLFVGTTGRDPLIRVDPDRTAEVLYPGVLGASTSGTSIRITALSWGTGTGLYAIRRFERGTGGNVVITYDLVRIETRLQGSYAD
jgi:hypothetical protein